MDLKKHGFWVAMGGGFAIALLAYVVLVPFGVSDEITKKGGKLRSAVRRLEGFAKIENPGDPKDGLPVKEAVSYWESRRASLEKELAAMRNHLRKKDENFERVVGGHKDDVSRFTVDLNRKLDELSKRYKLILPEGKHFKDLAPVSGGNPLAPDQKDQIPTVMKRFYLAEAIVEAAAASGATKLISIEFKEAPSALKPEERGEVAVQLFGATAILEMPVQGSTAGPEKLRTLRNSAKSSLGLYDESPMGLSTLVASFLQNPKLILQVAAITVEKTGFQNPEFEPYGLFSAGDGGDPFGGGNTQANRTFDDDVYIGSHNTEEIKESIPELREPPVRVTVEVNALDFHIPDDEERN